MSQREGILGEAWALLTVGHLIKISDYVREFAIFELTEKYRDEVVQALRRKPAELIVIPQKRRAPGAATPEALNYRPEQSTTTRSYRRSSKPASPDRRPL